MVTTDWVVVFAVVVFITVSEWKERKKMKGEKPPLGVRPERFWKEDRLKELERAISERVGAFCDIPLEWVIERNRMLDELEGLRVIR